MGNAEVITSIDISLNFRRRLFTFAESSFELNKFTFDSYAILLQSAFT
ncbi:MAG: hypothetical protein ACTS5R_01535 [Candidatus Hodgkinia cicadicola]